MQQERRADTEQRKADVDRLLEQSQLDLRKEAEISASLEQSKASLERQVKELKDKLEDIELGKSAGAQRTVMRLEARVEELQTRLQSETTARSTAVKEKRGAERELSEIQLKVDELAKEKAVLEEQSRKYEARLKSLRTQLVQAVGCCGCTAGRAAAPLRIPPPKKTDARHLLAGRRVLAMRASHPIGGQGHRGQHWRLQARARDVGRA